MSDSSALMPFLSAGVNNSGALPERHPIPTIYTLREFADAGGWISYGTTRSEVYGQAGVYAGRVLKGAKRSRASGCGASARSRIWPKVIRKGRPSAPQGGSSRGTVQAQGSTQGQAAGLGNRCAPCAIACNLARRP